MVAVGGSMVGGKDRIVLVGTKIETGACVGVAGLVAAGVIEGEANGIFTVSTG